MRILCLDYGDRTVGVAVSDQLHIIAYGLETIFRNSPNDLDDTDKRLLEIIKQYDVDRVVVGLPKKLDNSYGQQCEKTLVFKDHLSKLVPDLEIVLWDERMSSVAASRGLYDVNVNSFGQKKVIDKMAAVFILQGYLDFLKFQEEKNMDFDNFNSDDENVVVMFDEDGNEQELYVLGGVDYEGKTYLVVSEDFDTDSDEQEVIVLEKVVAADNDEDDYRIVEDDNILDNVMELFEEQYQDEYESEDGEDLDA